MRQGGIYQSRKAREINALIEAAEAELRKKYPALLEVFAADMSTIMEAQDKPLLFIEAEPHTAVAELEGVASDTERILGRALEPFSYRPYNPDRAEPSPFPEEPELRDIAVLSICDYGERRSSPTISLTTTEVK